ncbi:TetR/AcrR family transcriptional regulator [Streptomycetaceae bacterium NBC_01309]
MTAQVRRSYAKGRAKRREIIDQAVALFGEVGYRGASLREIAARCGISHPGLIHHFPTKEALLLAVLAQRDEDDARRLTAAGEVGVDRLRRTVEVVELNTRRRAIVEMFTALSAEATSAEHPAHAYFAERYRTTVAGLTYDYAHAREAGLLRPGIDPEEAARQLIALMDGLQVQWLIDSEGTDMAAIVRAHVQAQLMVGI